MANQALEFILPFATFILTFVVSFALFEKTKLLYEKKLQNSLISFVIASIFLTTSISTKFTLTLVTAFAILLISLTFLMLFTSLTETEKQNKKLGIGFTIAFLLVIFTTIAEPAFSVAQSTFYALSTFPRILTNSALFIALAGGTCWFVYSKT